MTTSPRMARQARGGTILSRRRAPVMVTEENRYERQAHIRQASPPAPGTRPPGHGEVVA